MDIVVVVECKTDLFEIVPALRSSCGFACGLHGRQQQCHQQTNDRNDDEQLHNRKSTDSLSMHVDDSNEGSFGIIDVG